jgi:hypothetical protein
MKNLVKILILLNVQFIYFGVNETIQAKSNTDFGELDVCLSKQKNVLKSNKDYSVQNEKTSTCEHIKHALDLSIVEGRKNKDAQVIIILRRGEKERGKNLIKNRISWVEKYLQLKEPTLKYVFAEGYMSNELGRIEIYIQGKLEWELFMRTNAIHNCADESY